MKIGLVLIFLFITSDCLAQQRADVNITRHYRGILITRTITTTANERDTSRILYINNAVGDSLAIYTRTGADLQCSVISIKPIDQTTVSLISAGQDSLTIQFDDATKQVLFGKDSYYLFDEYYQKLRRSILSEHSVMAVLTLLQDNLGDYLTESVRPLLQLEPGIHNSFIRKARVFTSRSQSDEIEDTWEFKYIYDTSGRLKSVTAGSGKVVCFKKTITYAAGMITKIGTYRNIEDRQITNATITYPFHDSTVKIRETVLETGKNWETVLHITLTKSAISSFKSMTLPAADVLKIMDKTSPSK